MTLNQPSGRSPGNRGLRSAPGIVARSYAMCVLATCLSVVGCAGEQRVNPSFSISTDEAERSLAQMQQAPVDLDRPLVILGGINELGYWPWRMRRAMEPALHGKTVTVIYPFATNFEQCRRKVVESVDRAFGVASDAETVEVDVIGQSMGGLVAIYASLDDAALGKRLKIRRLYTIGSPLNGARRANALAWLSPFSLHKNLRTDCDLQTRLRGEAIDFEIVSYSRLNDDTVGARYAYMPSSAGVWWVDNPPFQLPHTGCFADARVIGDIVRRLRGETPFTRGDPAPLPAEELR